MLEPHRSGHTWGGDLGGGKDAATRVGRQRFQVETNRVVHDVVLANRGCVLALGVGVAGNDTGDTGGVKLRRGGQACSVSVCESAAPLRRDHFLCVSVHPPGSRHAANTGRQPALVLL